VFASAWLSVWRARSAKSMPEWINHFLRRLLDQKVSRAPQKVVELQDDNATLLL
jgi:hypothetical protein